MRLDRSSGNACTACIHKRLYLPNQDACPAHVARLARGCGGWLQACSLLSCSTAIIHSQTLPWDCSTPHTCHGVICEHRNFKLESYADGNAVVSLGNLIHRFQLPKHWQTCIQAADRLSRQFMHTRLARGIPRPVSMNFNSTASKALYLDL